MTGKRRYINPNKVEAPHSSGAPTDTVGELTSDVSGFQLPKHGRPSKYSPIYCEQVIDHMANGASLTSFAAEIGVARSSINEWMQHHAEFSEAVGVAKAKCAAWWEAQGRHLAVNGGGNATLVLFGLKNMGADDWREKQRIEHGPTDGFAKFLAELSHRGSAVPVASERDG